MTDYASTIRAYDAERRANAMSRQAKIDYLHSKGWYKHHGNVWARRSDGIEMPFGAAIRSQLEQDIATGQLRQ